MRSTGTQPCLGLLNATQRAWFIADMAAVDRTRTPWLVVTIHQPFYNSNTKHSIAAEGLVVKDAIEDLLIAGGVDIVITGHVHSCTYPHTAVCVHHSSAHPL